MLPAMSPPHLSTAAISLQCSKRKQKKSNDIPPCKGAYVGDLGTAISFAANTMFNTGQELLMWSRESDCCLSSFAKLCLATSNQVFLPYPGTVM